jgi:hypothetical protein
MPQLLQISIVTLSSIEVYHDHVSEIVVLKRSVPQGSVLKRAKLKFIVVRCHSIELRDECNRLFLPSGRVGLESQKH